MKRLVFLLLTTFSVCSYSQSSDECLGVDAPENVRIYFSNGIQNDRDDREENYDALVSLVGLAPNVRDFGISVNKTEGFLLDLLQVFRQKSIESPEREYSTDKFWTWTRNLTIAPEWFKNEYRWYLSRFTDAIVRSDPDLAIQVRDYIKDLKQGKKVVIVAHSQGNLYANNAYRYIQNHPIYYKYQNSIGIVGVGTVSNQVADQIPINGNYDYYTLNGYDGVVNLLRIFSPVLPPTRSKNTQGDGLNHSFKYSYIAQDGFRPRIRYHIFKKIYNLDQPEIDFECQDPADVPVQIKTLPATQLTNTSAVLNGLVENGKNIDVYFVTRVGSIAPSCSEISGDHDGEGPWNKGDNFRATNGNVTSGFIYTYRACGKREDGAISQGNPVTFVPIFT